ncbi:T9SS type B sorting domain-containing protein [Algibacter sp. 2305UL17-15]|uniref:T9SS type B sorting domain-containing protein n=1 Tax=Algibacter sp. 2305UL17-15 TaxID=3231268 RepID=UPI0034586F2A
MIADATGYRLSVGTTSGGTDILNAINVGNVSNYGFTSDLPDDTEIFVSVIPYDLDGDAVGCSQESFKTEKITNAPRSFFTPNNDGTNDFWIVPNRLNDISTIYIYDRYGKFLKEVGDLQSGWDGTYNNKPLVTSDYWYLILYRNGETLKGHFSLIR